MQINYLAVLVCAVLSMVLGALWYGPLFGKKWMEIVGADEVDMERRKEMMKDVWKLYLTQFALTLVQLIVLAWYIGTLSDVYSGMHTAFSIWIAFVLPTVAAGSMWNNDSSRISWARFLIQTGYQFVFFILAGFILGMWR